MGIAKMINRGKKLFYIETAMIHALSGSMGTAEKEATAAQDPEFVAAKALARSAGQVESSAHAAWKIAEAHAENCDHLAVVAARNFVDRKKYNNENP